MRATDEGQQMLPDEEADERPRGQGGEQAVAKAVLPF
jgi:hypothetical protein